MDGASLGRVSVQFGAAPTPHKMLFLCCHSSSTPVLSTPMEGFEMIFFPAVSWKEPEQGKTPYCCICYLPHLDLHYWISSAKIYVHQTDNHYSFRSSWVMLARDKWWLQTATAATFNTDLVLRLFSSLCFLFDKFIYLCVHVHIQISIYNSTAKFRIGPLQVFHYIPPSVLCLFPKYLNAFQ